MKRLLIAEESLRDLKGHWFELIKIIDHTARDMGWQVDVAGNVGAVPQVAETFNLSKVFKHAKYLDQQKKLPFERFYGFILHSYRSSKTILPFLKSKKPYDHIFVPTVMIHHLLVWYFVMRYSKSKPQRLTLFFITNPTEWDAALKKPYFPKTSVVFKKVLLMFKGMVEKGEVSFAVGTAGSKAEFEELTGLPVKLMAQPVTFLPEEQKQTDTETSAKSNSAITLGCLGFARYEKGSDLLKGAIEHILNGKDGFEDNFLLQWLDPFDMPDGTVCEPGNVLKNNDHVTILDRPVGGAEYFKILNGVDCMVLPYRNSSYYARVSQIATECVCLGIPMIYTKGGWLEEIVVGYGSGIGIDDENTEELIGAIRTMSVNFDQYKINADKRKAEAIKYYSATNFCNLLLNVK